jgi:ATP-dependent Zn protease
VKQSHKTLLLWAFILVMSFALFQVFMASPTSRTVAFSEFINDVRQHHVVEVRVKDREITSRRTRAAGCSPASS